MFEPFKNIFNYDIITGYENNYNEEQLQDFNKTADYRLIDLNQVQQSFIRYLRLKYKYKHSNLSVDRDLAFKILLEIMVQDWINDGTTLQYEIEGEILDNVNKYQAYKSSFENIILNCGVRMNENNFEYYIKDIEIILSMEKLLDTILNMNREVFTTEFIYCGFIDPIDNTNSNAQILVRYKEYV